MAGRGPAPKETRSRARDQRPRDENLIVVEPDSELRGPELPDSHDWPAATLTWWQTWRESPQAQTFTETDWSFLLDTAILHAEFWLGDKSAAAELRLRVAKFGATPEDRLRLKIAVGEPKPAGCLQPKTAKKATVARKDRLLKAVGDGA